MRVILYIHATSRLPYSTCAYATSTKGEVFKGASYPSCTLYSVLPPFTAYPLEQSSPLNLYWIPVPLCSTDAPGRTRQHVHTAVRKHVNMRLVSHNAINTHSTTQQAARARSCNHRANHFHPFETPCTFGAFLFGWRNPHSVPPSPRYSHDEFRFGDCTEMPP